MGAPPGQAPQAGGGVSSPGHSHALPPSGSTTHTHAAHPTQQQPQQQQQGRFAAHMQRPPTGHGPANGPQWGQREGSAQPGGDRGYLNLNGRSPGPGQVPVGGSFPQHREPTPANAPTPPAMAGGGQQRHGGAGGPKMTVPKLWHRGNTPRGTQAMDMAAINNLNLKVAGEPHDSETESDASASPLPSGGAVHTASM